MLAEAFQLQLGFEAVLGFQDHVLQLIPVLIPFPDSTKVSGPLLVVNNEGVSGSPLHYIFC